MHCCEGCERPLSFYKCCYRTSVDIFARSTNSGSSRSAEHIDVSGTRSKVKTACSTRCLNVVGNNSQFVNRPSTDVLNEQPLVITRTVIACLSHSQRTFRL